MEESLLAAAFEKHITSNEKVIKMMLIYLKDGSKTNLVLNVLLLSDVVLWKSKFLILLLDALSNFTENFEDNRLLFSGNAMMSIALTADLLTKIANGKKRFQDECTCMKTEILHLGKIFNE